MFICWFSCLRFFVMARLALVDGAAPGLQGTPPPTVMIPWRRCVRTTVAERVAAKD